MKLKSWSWKQFNKGRRKGAAVEARILGLNLSYQALLIGGLTFILLLTGVSPIYISLGIFLLMAVISLPLLFVYRGFPYLRKFYTGTTFFSSLAVLAHVIYLIS